MMRGSFLVPFTQSQDSQARVTVLKLLRRYDFRRALEAQQRLDLLTGHQCLVPASLRAGRNRIHTDDEFRQDLSDEILESIDAVKAPD